MTPTVVIDGLTHRYGSHRALDNVSLTLGTGVTGLLGPNGAGKTTLLRILATVLAPSAGTVRCFDHDPGRVEGRLAIRRSLGYFPQEPGYYLNFTAFDFVDYVAILKEMTERNARRDEVRRVLDAVGLTDVMHKKIKALSGGMRRRVIIAQALLGDPHLLVLDEPTTGLDPEQRLRFRALVSEVAERHTVVLSTHQTEDVAALCQRVVVMDKGKVFFDGTTAEMTAQAKGRVWLSNAPDPAARLHWRTGDGTYRLIGDPPSRAKLAAPSIEDAYLLLLGRTPTDSDAAA
ncbi:MAG: ABC transporter ATP-binding protein [Acidimicrobiales bacterium]|nr:ABC transporter ATP-binding protein [Acidimicrobiales bacterium]